MEQVFRIPAGVDNLRIFLRNLPPANGAPVVAEKVVLYVHGATFPSALSVGYRFDGYSWMDDLAAAGFDVWAFDFLGCGESDRYPEMRGAPDAAPPLGRVPVASRQLEAAVAFIAARRGVERTSLIAHSWGTLPAARFAAEHLGRIERLALFGPIARREADRNEMNGTLPAHRDITVDAQWARCSGEVPAGQAQVFAERHFTAWGSDYLATDPASATRAAPGVRVPAGPMADIASAWQGDYPFDPAAISAPTLIIRGEWDTVSTEADAQWLFRSLTSAPLRRAVVVSRGTHVMHLEESRHQLYREVRTFLEGNDMPAR